MLCRDIKIPEHHVIDIINIIIRKPSISKPEIIKEFQKMYTKEIDKKNNSHHTKNIEVIRKKVRNTFSEYFYPFETIVSDKYVSDILQYLIEQKALSNENNTWKIFYTDTVYDYFYNENSESADFNNYHFLINRSKSNNTYKVFSQKISKYFQTMVSPTLTDLKHIIRASTSYPILSIKSTANTLYPQICYFMSLKEYPKTQIFLREAKQATLTINKLNKNILSKKSIDSFDSSATIFAFILSKALKKAHDNENICILSILFSFHSKVQKIFFDTNLSNTQRDLAILKEYKYFHNQISEFVGNIDDIFYQKPNFKLSYQNYQSEYSTKNIKLAISSILYIEFHKFLFSEIHNMRFLDFEICISPKYKMRDNLLI